MTEPQELRIGNYITSEGEIFVVDELRKDYIGAGALGVHPAGFELYLYVPLTEEWLIKFGFILYEESHHKFPSTKDTFDRTKIVERLDRVYRYRESSIEESADDMDIMVISDPSTMKLRSMSVIGVREYFCCADIQFVHQLQNLYYSLTGTELTIKEK